MTNTHDTRAREAQADTYCDEIVDIADDGSNDWMMRNGLPMENAESVRRSHLRVEARKWVAGKLRPKKYGDKAGADEAGDAPVENKLIVEFVGGFSGAKPRDGE